MRLCRKIIDSSKVLQYVQITIPRRKEGYSSLVRSTVEAHLDCLQSIPSDIAASYANKSSCADGPISFHNAWPSSLALRALKAQLNQNHWAVVFKQFQIETLACSPSETRKWSGCEEGQRYGPATSVGDISCCSTGAPCRHMLRKACSGSCQML